MPPTITALDAPVAALGECPLWSSVESALYWVDIDGQTIHRFHSPTGDTTTRPVDGRPGSIALMNEAGSLLVAVEHQLLVLDWATGELDALGALERERSGNRLNDGRCDPAGRFVVGSMFADTTAGNRTGILHQVAPGAPTPSTILRRNIGVTNGLAFDADRSRMYFADTPTEKVLVFDYDSVRGSVSGERLFFDYSSIEGKPDGACVDADGHYWSASVYGWALARIAPDGTVDRTIELPLQKPSMPCFGGPDMDVLYVTTIGSGGTVPSEPGRDGFVPGSTLVITGLGIRGQVEPVFGATDLID